LLRADRANRQASARANRTFAYISPKQTGRMNRSIDPRSDLYSLSVTLYEMVTGSLPFTASAAYCSMT
jgi:serine/threonine protein kinase